MCCVLSLSLLRNMSFALNGSFSGHMVHCTALELDLPLTPPTQASSTLLWLPGPQLPLEQLSPLHTP